ncbi:MAG: class I SAM-dependent methyltransferase [Pseudomonadota bacterium]
MDRMSKEHWDGVYNSKRENEVSWFQDTPALSLDFIDRIGARLDSSIVDVGGGASRLVDSLIARGFKHVTVLDLSDAALAVSKARLAEKANCVEWIVADVTKWNPDKSYDLWHDRAAFHFLTEQADRKSYVDRLVKSLRLGGHAIIGTFALDGPERCSGLPIVRYSPDSLAETLGSNFQLISSQSEEHTTPWGSVQRFQFSTFLRTGRE